MSVEEGRSSGQGADAGERPAKAQPKGWGSRTWGVLRAVGRYLPALLKLGTGYKAKLLCSGIFVAKRSAESLLTEDLAVNSLAPLRAFSATVNKEQQSVTVSFLGLGKRTAVYRPGLGSTLLFKKSAIALRQQSKAYATWRNQHPRQHIPLPEAEFPPANAFNNSSSQPALTPAQLQQPQLQQAIDAAFAEPHPPKQARTRAVVVLHRGKLVAERYAPGFSAHTPFLGWSATKSILNALIGTLVHSGRLSLEQDDLFPAWRSPGDPRRRITLDQLLRMSSGLNFVEKYSSPLADATIMLFQRGDQAAYAANCPLAAPPGSTFSYSSGTTVLLSKLIKQTLGDDLTAYFSFPQRALFDRVGMASAVLEPDETGVFTGSSFVYATARDWAKLGLLYLQDGCWAGERLLPEGWVAYSTGESDTTPFYGAHFWRGVPDSFAAGEGERDGWPEDAYLASGYQGQFVTVVPSREMVVVRMGLSQQKNSWNQVEFIRQVMAAVTA